MNVLVIDDEKYILDMISMLLQFEQIETTVTDNLQEAHDLIAEKKPDVICCDLMMPDGGGIKLLEEKRNYMNGAGPIPVVIITGTSSEEMLNTAETLGSHAIVKKPFTTVHLISVIREAAGATLC